MQCGRAPGRRCVWRQALCEAAARGCCALGGERGGGRIASSGGRPPVSSLLSDARPSPVRAARCRGRGAAASRNPSGLHITLTAGGSVATAHALCILDFVNVTSSQRLCNSALWHMIIGFLYSYIFHALTKCMLVYFKVQGWFLSVRIRRTACVRYGTVTLTGGDAMHPLNLGCRYSNRSIRALHRVRRSRSEGRHA